MKELLEAYLGRGIQKYNFHQYISIDNEDPSSNEVTQPGYIYHYIDCMSEKVFLEDLLVFLFNRTK